jgi:cytochrome P450
MPKDYGMGAFRRIGQRFFLLGGWVMWSIFHGRRVLLSYMLEGACLAQAAWAHVWATPAQTLPAAPWPAVKKTPADFAPLTQACFDDPYPFYRLLQSDYPVYQLPNGIYCISRYTDMQAVCMDTAHFSSKYQGIAPSLKPGQDIEKLGRAIAKLADWGLTPADVLAVDDPPAHMGQRKAIGRGFAMQAIKDGEPMVEALAQEILDELLPQGQMDFVHDFGWRLPMLVIMRVLGLPDSDFARVKDGALHAISLQTGIADRAAIGRHQAGAIRLVRYSWTQFLAAQGRDPQGQGQGAVSPVMAMLIRATLPAADGSAPAMSQAQAVSAIFQLLVAGSDSSATSMGSAIKMLLDNPDLAQAISQDLDGKLDPFIDEVFRLEAAFQGHFRWVTQDTSLHGVALPRGSRVFLIWAAGNRDASVFPQPDSIDLHRANGRKHLTFGWGPHACIGRELARSEIRIVLRTMLTRTQAWRQVGEAPYMASMFSRSLEHLPLALRARAAGDASAPVVADQQR